jgi:hypothetical protein
VRFGSAAESGERVRCTRLKKVQPLPIVFPSQPHSAELNKTPGESRAFCS